ncbi:MAG: hypothetical protein ACTHJW_26605 [Streptosporangiaceae bacterium]
MPNPRNLDRAECVQLDMRASKGLIVRSCSGAVMAGAVVLTATACGISGQVASGGASGTASAQSPQPGTGRTVTLSRAPRPGKLTPAPTTPVGHRTITAGHSRQVTVTTSDDGATVVLVPGQVISVVLRGQGVPMWNRPRLAGVVPGVLRQLSASGGYPSRAPGRADYRAVHPGTATILSATNARCLHAQPACAIPERLWRVTVVVRALTS